MPSSQRDWLLGMALVFVVALIWVAASFLVQSVESSGVAPFFVSYICNSLFIIFLPIVKLGQWLKLAHGDSQIFFGRLWAFWSPATSASWIPVQDRDEKSMASLGDITAASGSAVAEAPAGSHRMGGSSRSSWRTAWASLIVCPFWFMAQFTFNVSLGLTTVTSNTILSSAASLFTLIISVLFLREPFTCLKLSSVFLCMLGTAVVSLADASATPASQKDQHQVSMARSLWGDVLCLISAMCYAVYTALIKHTLSEKAVDFDGDGQLQQPEDDTLLGASSPLEDRVTAGASKSAEDSQDVWGARSHAGEEETLSMALFFGYLGLFNAVLLAPVGLALHLTGVEPLHRLSTWQWTMIIVKGLFDNVLSDYLWAWAVLLMTPTAATAGLAVQIPLAMVADSVVKVQWPGLLHVTGAVIVTAGFLGINAPVTNCTLGQEAGFHVESRDVRTADQVNPQDCANDTSSQHANA